MSSTLIAADEQALAPSSSRRSDRLVRRLLRISEVRPSAAASAHRAFRTSLLVTAVRCTIIYLAVPILVPVIGVARDVSIPLSLALCVVALVSGTIGVRRFWIADHRLRWPYTAFILVVFAFILTTVVLDIAGLVAR